MCKIFAITKGVNFMEEELLFFDELTKIYNRKGFFTYTALLLEEHPGIDFCLIYWNIQQFKVLNNLFGLQTGDQILIHIAIMNSPIRLLPMGGLKRTILFVVFPNR